MAHTEIQASCNVPAQAHPAPSLPDLHDRLDALWISHLRHLDAYTTAQRTLQQHMRSGFFSLSRANFNARPGARYGKDYFHDRAKATRRVEVSQEDGEDGDGRLQLAIVQSLPVSDDHGDGVATKKAAAAGEDQQQPSPPATPGPDEDDNSRHSTNKFEENPGEDNREDDDVPPEAPQSKPPLEADPLRWYGILVPRELRSAQASFSSAVDGSVSEAVNASRSMRETEVEIRKLRKEIRRAEKVTKV